MRNVEDKVRDVLEKFPETRSDDYLLVGFTWAIHYGIDPSKSIAEVFRHHEKYKLPGWDSIRRCRQKIQEREPSLRADKQTEDIRLNKQKDYIAYSMEV